MSIERYIAQLMVVDREDVFPSHIDKFIATNHRDLGSRLVEYRASSGWTSSVAFRRSSVAPM